MIVEPRHARGGTLVLGGGFAGSYVARLLGKRGATIVSEENFMLYTPMLPEAASGSLEPRHVVVPLRMMCPHSELLLGRLTALDHEQRVATIQVGAENPRRPLRAGRPRAGLVPPRAADPRARRAWAQLQGHHRRDLSPQPRAAKARSGRGRKRPPARRGAPHVRLRRSGLRGSRGARRAFGSRPRRAPLLPAVPAPAPALGARRRGAEDPARDPDTSG